MAENEKNLITTTTNFDQRADVNAGIGVGSGVSGVRREENSVGWGGLGEFWGSWRHYRGAEV